VPGDPVIGLDSNSGVCANAATGQSTNITTTDARALIRFFLSKGPASPGRRAAPMIATTRVAGGQGSIGFAARARQTALRMSGPAGVRLRIDPWAADYDGAQGLLDADEPAAAVDAGVETAAWQALRPAARSGPPPALRFVDGVRRIDCRFVAEAGDRSS